MNDCTFVLVTRKTRLQELVERFNSWAQAKFYLEHNQVNVQDYLDENVRYQSQIQEAESILRTLGRFQRIERSMLTSYQFGQTDVVVVIGQDGLVANTLKYLNRQPLIAINPDPKRWDGVLLPFELAQLKEVVTRTTKGKLSSKNITLAQASTNDGQVIYAVNDLFIGPKSHTSARYCIRWNQMEEVQSSSGIIVSTGLGSSGWLQSIVTGASGVAGMANEAQKEIFDWSEQRLKFAVREPFPSQTTGTQCVYGEIKGSEPLGLESYMPENGVIFSDGIEDDFIQFNSGCLATIKVAERQGNLITN
ncbi:MULTISPECIES: sugar kinase [unclassified Oleiphilus]|uniref:sugar kinase n=1 Tax=unclassified Oleiphilus TaxID=2631174 RepID=UPI0007C31595|nr:MULTISPECIES: sugar kinase [unclassified Oleiphilus]KZY45121.1 sugar kinase [Oleiphilus sp. HI0050]KZZ36630.1 sugar kinase [Oleiphilus sp. HI0117]KZZ56290.1 sugar kinase [Oleiphilus sp. HI0123]